jgi:copper resistance protein C
MSRHSQARTVTQSMNSGRQPFNIANTRVLSRALSLAIATIASVVMLTPIAAQAHAQLVSSDPQAGSVVNQLPEQVTLTFDQALLTVANPNHISVIDPMGMQIAADPVLKAPNIISSVISPSMLMAGVYKVSFRVVSADGHPVEGAFQFALGKAASSGAPISVPTSGKVTLTAHATGDQIPDGAGDPSGVADGTFTIDFSTQTICFTVVSKLPGVTGMHIHARNMNNLTVSDEISIPVAKEALNSATPVCTKPGATDLAKFAAAPDRFALVVHTNKYPEGAVLGVFKGDRTLSTGDQTSNHAPWWVIALAVLFILALIVAVYVRRRGSETPS